MNKKHFVEQTKSELFQEFCYLAHKQSRLKEMQRIVTNKLYNIEKDWKQIELKTKEELKLNE